MIPTDKRVEKFKSIVAKKQYNLGIVLENVHNPHNIGAVLRSCDAVGVMDVYLIYTADRLGFDTYKKGSSSAQGADKWLNVHVYDNLENCMKEVNTKYDKVYATNFTEEAKSLYDLELSGSVALVFGNELDGVTTDMMQYVDGNFIIPQEGMAQSLNISVACAVSLYEVRRQRALKKMYDTEFDENLTEHQLLFRQYMETHEKRYKRKHGIM